MNSRRILVATDFSTRSDRALRRAVLIARDFDAALTLVHVVDDDQPQRIVKAERKAASALLNDTAQTLRSADSLECEPMIVEGDPFEGIVKTAEKLGPELVVIGPHRRRALKDMFVGTTAERTIRASRWPVLMANGVPAAPHRKVLIAVDFSDCSAGAVRSLQKLELDRGATVATVHVFDVVGTGLVSRASIGEDSVKEYLADEEARAFRELTAFLAELGFGPVARIVKRNDSSVGSVICKVAEEISATLLVVGSRGQTGLARFVLGSVAEEVLRSATIDVLAVPPEQAGP